MTGESHSFTVVGILHNDTEGDYVRDQADGIQNMPEKNMSDLDSDGKTINAEIFDIDGQKISGARIELWDSLDAKIDEKTTSALGKVTFTDLDTTPEEYTLKSYYMVGSKDYLINTTTVITSGQINNTVIFANLTTVEFFVYDSNEALISDDRVLHNANVTILDLEENINITSALTDFDGMVSFKLPATEYNVSVQYQNNFTSIKVNNTGEFAPSTILITRHIILIFIKMEFSI